ncbi:MAG TPA: GIY-YIG nuclease family protein [Patescibacteria group bacterium]|nr:GIY-YIG nuclease family protein [Patescibacteria group bacterium]
MKKFIVYILISLEKNNWSYVGCTGNLKQRIRDHNQGKTRSTKAYRPLKVIYTESFCTNDRARKRELYLKSGIGREYRYKIIKKYYSRIV